MERQRGEEVKRLAEQHREQLGAVQRQFRQANVKVANLMQVRGSILSIAGNDRAGEEELKGLAEPRGGQAGVAPEEGQGADGRRARGGHTKFTGQRSHAEMKTCNISKSHISGAIFNAEMKICSIS